MSKRSRIRTLAMAGLVAASSTLGVHVAEARDGDIIRRGLCSNGGTWKLKVGPRDGGFQTEFEVDTNRVGQTFGVRLVQNGVVVFQGTRTTTAPSGSFEIKKLLPNHAGTDTIKGFASNGRQTCQGSITI